MTKYTLFDGSQPIRTADNVNGLKLSALFHVNTGDRVLWELTQNEPAQVSLERGIVFSNIHPQGKLRFCIAVYE